MNNIIKNYPVKCIDIKNSNNNFINTKIQKIYVINLKENILRRNYILVIMKKYNINFTLVIVNKINNLINDEINNNKLMSKGEIGCLLSHLWCLNETIINNFKNVIILEDDIIFHKNFNNLFFEIFKRDYDFLLLGACDFNFSELNKKNINNNLYVPCENSTRVYGAHANYYSLKGAKIMFNEKYKNISFIDRNYLNMFYLLKGNAFICYPNLIVSDISTSNLNHKYDFLSIQEELYYKKCFVNFKFSDYNFIYLDIIEKCKKIQIKEIHDYEQIINKMLYFYFQNISSCFKLKQRLVLNFFTCKDLKNIISLV